MKWNNSVKPFGTTSSFGFSVGESVDQQLREKESVFPQSVRQLIEVVNQDVSQSVRQTVGQHASVPPAWFLSNLMSVIQHNHINYVTKHEIVQNRFWTGLTTCRFVALLDIVCRTQNVAVLSTVLWGGIGAFSWSIPWSSATSHRTFGPFGPCRVISINCFWIKVTNYIISV